MLPVKVHFVDVSSAPNASATRLTAATARLTRRRAKHLIGINLQRGIPASCVVYQRRFVRTVPHQRRLRPRLAAPEQCCELSWQSQSTPGSPGAVLPASDQPWQSQSTPGSSRAVLPASDQSWQSQSTPGSFRPAPAPPEQSWQLQTTPGSSRAVLAAPTSTRFIPAPLLQWGGVYEWSSSASSPIAGGVRG